MKQTFIAGALAATMATGAQAQNLKYSSADECFFNEAFSLASEFQAGTTHTISNEQKEQFIEECEADTGTQATGFSYGLKGVSYNGARIEFAPE
ncbi:MAG: hypothetical protein ACLFR0_09680 [Alphaproteobacteria bacterium]